MNYYVHVLRRLNKIFPKQLLLKIYKSYVQSKIDFGLSIWGCTTEGILDRVPRLQNFCARIICKKYDYVNTRGTDLVGSLKIQTIRQRRDYAEKYAKVVSHIKEVCYEMNYPMGLKNPVLFMHLKVIIVSTVDKDSPHTMAFVFVVLLVPCLNHLMLYH